MTLGRSATSGLVSRAVLTIAVVASLAVPQSGFAQEQADEASAAQETEFSKGSTFGIIPFEGVTEAVEFTGFADLETSATVMINELPAEAWDELEANFTKPESLVMAEITATSIENLTIAGMPAIRVAGTQSKQGLDIPKCLILLKGREKVGFLTAQIPFADNFSGDACSMIKGIAQRQPEPLSAKLAALPFSLSDMAGLRVTQVIGGSGVVLTKGPLDTAKAPEQPVMIIASSIAATASGFDRLEFSESAMSSIALHSLGETIESVEMTLAGFPVTRLTKSATHNKSGEDVRMVQWVVFKPDGNYVRLIGIANNDLWTETFPDFEMVAAGLSLR